jgi:dUTPase
MGGLMQALSEKDLLSAVEEGTFIKDGSKESCEGIKYDFLLSNMVLTVDNGRPRDISQHSENAVIKPGEVAFVITKESLELPGDMYCQLSTKRKLSLDGIITLGGLIIDPNYEGKLIFGLYNLSSRNYPLMPGKKLVAGVFYKVDKKSSKRPEPIYDFPDDLVKIVVDTKPNSVNALNAAIDELRKEILDIRKQLIFDDKWRNDFQNGLTEIQQLMKEMGRKLDTEIDERKDSVGRLKARTSIITGIGLILGFIFGGGLVSLIVMYIAGILRFS